MARDWHLAHMRGAALLLVLWLVALLAVIVGSFAFAARTEHLLGRVSGDAVVAQQAARAGLEYAITRVGEAGDASSWWPDGRTQQWQLGDIKVQVQLTDEQGKIDLNHAPVQLLAQLLQALEVPSAQAQQLAGAIVDWRDEDTLRQAVGGAEDADYLAANRPYGAKDGAFESVSELQQVLGMDAKIYAAMLPNVTIYSHNANPDVAFAPAPVLRALGLDAEQVLRQRQMWQPGAGAAVQTPNAGARPSTRLGIVSRAQLPHGYVGQLYAVVETSQAKLPHTAYTVLLWEEGSLLR